VRKFWQRKPKAEDRAPDLDRITPRSQEFILGARQGWMRACVWYMEMSKFECRDFMAEMNRRWPLPPLDQPRTLMPCLHPWRYGNDGGTWCLDCGEEIKE
jgi:hypothetical protein